MVTFYLDTTEASVEVSEFRIDIEFYYYLRNYLKLFDNKDPFGNPWGYMTGSELDLKVKNLPHSWILAQPEIKQIVNGEEIVVQRRFTEDYINELKLKLLKLAELAKKNECLIRWG